MNETPSIADQVAAKRTHMLDAEPHEPAPIPSNFHERVAEVEDGINALAGVDITPSSTDEHRNLIDSLQDVLLGVPSGQERSGTLEISDSETKAIVNAAFAAAADLKRRADALTKQRDAIVDVLKQALGDNEELVIDGAVLATYKVSAARVLNQAHLKKIFPDTPENAECWTDQERRTFLFK